MKRTRRSQGDPLAIKRKMMMLQKGITQADLVERWGVSQPFVSHLVNGHDRSLERERDLAEMLGLPHEELFPPPTDRQLAGVGQGGE